MDRIFAQEGVKFTSALGGQNYIGGDTKNDTSEQIAMRSCAHAARASTDAAPARRKHGVSVELAATVSRDPLALSRYDDEHSEESTRKRSCA